MENPSPSERAVERDTLVDPREALALVRAFARDLEEHPDELPPLTEPTRAETVQALADYLADSDPAPAQPGLLARVEAAQALHQDTQAIRLNTAAVREFVSDWTDR